MKHRQFDQHVQKCKTMKYHGRQKGNITCLNGRYSRKRAGWGLGGSWDFHRSELQSLFQGGLASQPPRGIFFLYIYKGNKTYFFSGQDTWWFRFRRRGTGAQKYLFFEILSKFQFKMAAEHKVFSSSSCSSPNPTEIIARRTEMHYPQQWGEQKNCKGARASNLLLKVRKRIEAHWKRKPSVGSYGRPPWEKDAVKATVSGRVTEKLPNWCKSERVRNNVTKIKSNDERSV